MSKKPDNPVSKYIEPININGLRGRMLFMPSAKPSGKRNMLFVYGHHSTIERMSGLIENLGEFGSVTITDLPGFGGMDSLYKVGKVPTVDELADYLATFVKLRFRRKKITIVGFSFGFVVVTRMLQKYPDIAARTELLVSAVGFAHKDDFVYSRPRLIAYKSASGFLSRRIPSLIFRATALNSHIIRLVYAHTKNAKEKFKGLSKQEAREVMGYEIHLWHANDLRTHMKTTNEFFVLDNCGAKVDMPVHHVFVNNDRYFDNHKVEQHLAVIFSSVNSIPAPAESHGPSIILTKQEAAPFVPQKLQRLLRKPS